MRLRGRRVFCTDLGGGGWDISAYVSTDRWFDGHLHISQYSRHVFGHDGLASARVIYGGVDAARFSPAWVGVIYPLTRIATALTMAFELGAPLFLYAYYRGWRARWIWIALGVSFEIGIAVGLRLGSFPYGMLALYPVLVYASDFECVRPAVPRT